MSAVFLPISALPSNSALPAGLHHPGERSEHRGLAGAVGAEDRHLAALLDLEVDALDHQHLAVGRAQVLDLEQAHAGAPR